MNYTLTLALQFQRLPAYPPLSVVDQLILKEKRGNCVPVFVELPGDLLTPCVAYLRIAKESKYSFLLESVENGQNLARYSFVGAGTSERSFHGSLYLRISQILSRS